MKYYVFGKWEKGREKDEIPFDIFIGIKARNGEEAYAKLARLVDTSEGFILYDTYEA